MLKWNSVGSSPQKTVASAHEIAIRHRAVKRLDEVGAVPAPESPDKGAPLGGAATPDQKTKGNRRQRSARTKQAVSVTDAASPDGKNKKIRKNRKNRKNRKSDRDVKEIAQRKKASGGIAPVRQEPKSRRGPKKRRLGISYL